MVKSKVTTGAKPPVILTQAEIDAQEGLTAETLKKLEKIPLAIGKATPRPEMLCEIMEWAYSNFASSMDRPGSFRSGKTNAYLHSIITIDGSFLQFAKEKGIVVSCLYKECISSFSSGEGENKVEKFLAHGVFRVVQGENAFIQATVFHREPGCEEELAFFVIVPDESLSSYLSLRNEYEQWLHKRLRGSPLIQVFGGEPIRYSKEETWEDLFLPEGLKKEIRGTVESFLSSEDFYKENNLPWKRGMLLYGTQGCGKTTVIKTLLSQYPFKGITIAAGMPDEAMQDAFACAEEQSPALLYFEDLDSMLGTNIDPGSFLNAMDGIAAKNGLFVLATANSIKRFPPNIIDRPSRFDRKFEIPLPDQQMSEIYLSKWFGKILSKEKIKQLSIFAVKQGFSYAWLKELYLSTMFESLANNRKVPNEKDIEQTLTRLVKDRKAVITADKKISTDKYFS
jgi:hypothetical protein